MAGSGQQDPKLSFEALYEQAKAAGPQLEMSAETILADLRKRHPGLFEEAYYESGELKDAERAKSKIKLDYGGDQSQISDLTRGRIVVSTSEQVVAVQQYLSDNTQKLGIEKAKDHFADPAPSHYRTINLKARMPNGHVVELRFDHTDMIAATQSVRGDYEAAQAIERRLLLEERVMTPIEAERYERLMDRMRDAHDAAASKAGLNGLVNERGEKRLIGDATLRVARDAAHGSKLAALIEELGKRSGVVGGIIVGTGMLASGSTPSEAAAGVAEAVVPGVSSGKAFAEGRAGEGFVRGIEEIPVGLLVTEFVRPVGRKLGADLDASIAEGLLGILKEMDELDEHEALFVAIYERLPHRAVEGMPPEIESLVELKRLVMQGEEAVPPPDKFNGAERESALMALARYQRLYTDAYNDVIGNDGLDGTIAWLREAQGADEPGVAVERPALHPGVGVSPVGP